MAASLETSAFLLALCRASSARSALDLGSGFSSYVLRHYAGESGANVASVDDDPRWLAKTEEFLTKRGLRASPLGLWPEIPGVQYDVVFHDLANGEMREAAMPVALAHAGRFVVFDDAHHLGHREAMTATCGGADVPLFSLRAVTLDGVKRYAMLACR